MHTCPCRMPNCKSRPQAAAQTFLVAQLDSDDQSWAMLASIVGCIVSIAYLVATTELDLDTSLEFRTKFPMVHGYIPTESAVWEVLVLLGIVFFVGGVLGAKLIALTTLAPASAWVAVAWCSAEASALFVLRYFAEGRIWRFHVSGGSGLMPTLVLHVCVYLGMLAAPFPFLRYSSARPPSIYVVIVVPMQSSMASSTFHAHTTHSHPRLDSGFPVIVGHFCTAPALFTTWQSILPWSTLGSTWAVAAL